VVVLPVQVALAETLRTVLVHQRWPIPELAVVAVRAAAPATVVRAVAAAADSSLSTGGSESALELPGLVPPHIA
jgi:hypothetical protein